MSVNSTKSKQLEEALAQLSKLREEVAFSRKTVSALRTKVLEAETVFIGLKIREENLAEEVRRLEVSLPEVVSPKNEEDLNLFKEKLPALMEEVKT